jgi:hypothetical protein
MTFQITIFKTVLDKNSYFKRFFGALVFFVLFVTVFTLRSWNMFLIYPDVKGEIPCLIIFSFYM